MHTSQPSDHPVTMIAINIGKTRSTSPADAIVLRTKVSRSQLARRLANLPRSLVGLEAGCGAGCGSRCRRGVYIRHSSLGAGRRNCGELGLYHVLLGSFPSAVGWPAKVTLGWHGKLEAGAHMGT